MAIARARHRRGFTDYWPGFVDVLSTLLLVFVFLLSIFSLAQFFLSREISGQDVILTRLNAQIAELTEQLALEKAEGATLANDIAALQASLAAAEGERDRLRGEASAAGSAAGSAGARIAELSGALENEKSLSQRALSQVELLNQQIAALRRQIAALESALEASESRETESQTRIADLGKRLNIALAQRVQELSRYRSDFFGRLREILGERRDVRIVGDRFVFQSEVFFASGSDEINPAGRVELDKIAAAIVALEKEIPSEIAWVLRVDGHTDKRPITSPRFRNNWDLSAGRAISVVRYLIDKGVPPVRLAAAGFGEFQPLEPGEGEEIFARNRRIELKLTER